MKYALDGVVTNDAESGRFWSWPVKASIRPTADNRIVLITPL